MIIFTNNNITIITLDDLAVEQAMQHQLLCYLQLLETNKPYLLGLTRVPGIHTLLLFSKTSNVFFLLILFLIVFKKEM